MRGVSSPLRQLVQAGLQTAPTDSPDRCVATVMPPGLALHHILRRSAGGTPGTSPEGSRGRLTRLRS